MPDRLSYVALILALWLTIGWLALVVLPPAVRDIGMLRIGAIYVLPGLLLIALALTYDVIRYPNPSDRPGWHERHQDREVDE